MLTALDLLVVVFMALAALSVLATALMFLIRNKTAQRVFFYITVALGLVAAYIGVSIGSFLFPVMTAVALFFGSVSAAALVLHLVKKNNDKIFLLAKIAAAVSLVFGIINAIS